MAGERLSVTMPHIQSPECGWVCYLPFNNSVLVPTMAKTPIESQITAWKMLAAGLIGVGAFCLIFGGSAFLEGVNAYIGGGLNAQITFPQRHGKFGPIEPSFTTAGHQLLLGGISIPIGIGLCASAYFPMKAAFRLVKMRPK